MVGRPGSEGLLQFGQGFHFPKSQPVPGDPRHRPGGAGGDQSGPFRRSGPAAGQSFGRGPDPGAVLSKIQPGQMEPEQTDLAFQRQQGAAGRSGAAVFFQASAKKNQIVHQAGGRRVAPLGARLGPDQPGLHGPKLGPVIFPPLPMAKPLFEFRQGPAVFVKGFHHRRVHRGGQRGRGQEGLKIADGVAVKLQGGAPLLGQGPPGNVGGDGRVAVPVAADPGAKR